MDTVQYALDWLTGFGLYQNSVHCFGGDWHWISIFIILNIILVLGYFDFTRLVYRQYRKAGQRKLTLAQHGLASLTWVFFWCAVAGYIMDVVMIFWPARKLKVLIMIPLCIWTWSLVRHAKHKEFIEAIFEEKKPSARDH